MSQIVAVNPDVTTRVSRDVTPHEGIPRCDPARRKLPAFQQMAAAKPKGSQGDANDCPVFQFVYKWPTKKNTSLIVWITYRR